MDWRLPFLLRTLTVRSRLLTNFKLEPHGWVSYFDYLSQKRKQGCNFRPSRSTVSTTWMHKLLLVDSNNLVSVVRWENMLLRSTFFYYFLLHTVDLPFYSLSALCFSSFSSFLSYTNIKSVHINLGHRMWRTKKKIAPRCTSISIFLSLTVNVCTKKLNDQSSIRWQSVEWAQSEADPSFGTRNVLVLCEFHYHSNIFNTLPVIKISHMIG